MDKITDTYPDHTNTILVKGPLKVERQPLVEFLAFEITLYTEI